MKSRCPDPSPAATLMLLMDNELGEPARAALVQRLGTDGVGRLAQHERLRAQLSSPSRCAGEVDLVEAVHDSLQRREQAARSPARHLWVGALASAASIALVLGMGHWHPAERDVRASHGGAPEFRAKAATENEDARWVGVHVYRVERGREPTRIAGDIEAGAPLLFSYANIATPPLGHLLVFAVDSSAKVFWFHPAHPARGPDPTSIPIVRTAAHVPIPEVIRQPLAIGDVEFYAVFTREPLHVRDVDAWLRSHPGRRYALPSSQGMVQVIAARVVP